MKLTNPCYKLIKRYCTRTPNLTNATNIIKNVEIGSEISVFKIVTKDDILNFAKLTGDYNPVHIKASNNLVHGALLNGLVSGVLGTKLPGPGTLVLEQNLIFPEPCYAGDTIEIKVQIISARKIMKCEYICIANGEKIILKGNAKLIKQLNTKI